MKAIDVLKLAPVDLDEMTKKLIQRKKAAEVRDGLMAISKFAAMAAMYIHARVHDQDHNNAVKAAQKAAEIVWVKAFGYNGYHKFTF